MTGEQKDRLAELLEKQKNSERQKELKRLEEQLNEEIPGFYEKYFFADPEQTKRLAGFAEKVHKILTESGHEYSQSETIAENRLVWMQFFLGVHDIFSAFVGGRAADFLADMDDWQECDPFDTLLFDDLSGSVFIDRKGKITEITL